ncbi:MAG: Ig-like domain repeat protein, partial [Propionibacteriaceae bacterium]|nr:Ig-like domain repeat protein [Propionibacteriaceae bacterium]
VLVGFALKAKPVKTHTALTLSQRRVPFGTAVTATATVRGASTGTVVFRCDGGRLTADLLDGVATVALPADLPAGHHTVRARFTGTDEAKPSRSRTVLLTVTRA